VPDLLLPFLGVVAVLTVTPGPDMVLVLRNGLRWGTRAAWLTGLGCCLGISLHATLAVLGLSAVLATSAALYAALELAGGAYLAYLGVRSLLAALRPAAHAAPVPTASPVAAEPSTPSPDPTPGPGPGLDPAGPAPAAPAAPGGVDADGGGLAPWAAFRQGLGTNLLNPKIAVLFLTLLPQFVAPGEPRLRTTAQLALTFLVIAVLWWRLFSLALSPAARILRGPRVGRVLDALTGTVLISLGIRVALESR
jgi:threonine/homoserine/homoserine lactone efflux protein